MLASMLRRDLLKAALLAQAPASPPPPPKAKITSSVMLWTLKGSFEEKVEIAARAGLQSVELVAEYAGWTDADIARALKHCRSFKMGMDFSNMYRWKNTIGDVAERKQNWNVWQDPQSPHYNQTLGLGFYEYFQLCEDLGAEPVPVVNCGMCCQARQGPPVPLDRLDPYVQDALDLIEFANGPAPNGWGAKRAAMGHPKPFHVKFIAVGNEQWGQGYFDRYVLFQRAIKAKYPDVAVISTSGPFVNDPLWEFAWNKFRSGTPADLVDEHYYVVPRWFLENVDRYASYDRKGPKIFVGEFAAQDSGRHNDLRAALSEAAYLTGLLQNADVVSMASYAPLLAKAGHAQWRPDLIWFDNTRVVLTPDYYVQKIFSRNRPDVVLPTRVEAPKDVPQPRGMIGVGTWNTQAEFKDIHVTSAGGRTLYESDFSHGLKGWKTAGGDWKIVDGALRQDAVGQNIRAVTGDPSWTDYTLTLKARKLGGQEGFLILFQTADVDAPTWWNIGGWGNTDDAFQGGGFPENRLRGPVETGRWYDIRIESRGGSVKGYLDGQLVQQAERHAVSTLYAVAGLDRRENEFVLQMVNPFAAPMTVAIKLNGLPSIGNQARVTILANVHPEAENTFDQPDAVVPQTSTFAGVAPEFSYTLQPCSLTTLRISQK